ncbi:hypothetical protein QE152_g34335 [Popillia japonica]|uniref:Endonuclease-reverse transcriptase n=1 Tax=Popillia japonica TaxID=7064 RepID=A0AAW1IUC9_POPJA
MRARLPRLRPRKNTKRIVTEVNNILRQEVSECKSVTELHQLVYIGAATVLISNKQELQTLQAQPTLVYIGAATVLISNKQELQTLQAQPTTQTRAREKPWEIRLTNKIENYRKEIGVLTQIKNAQNPTNRLTNKANFIIRKYTNSENANAMDVLDLIKQRLAVNANRLRRYKVSHKRKTQNRQFSNNQKAFYRNLNPSTTNAEETQATEVLQVKDAMDFWRSIWTKEEQHNENAKWIRQEKDRVEKVQYMTDNEISIDDVKAAMKRLQNWKAPGIDGVQNYWIRAFHITLHLLYYLPK